MKLKSDGPNRRLLLGITGGIAAYKAPLIIREFKKLNIEVKPVATRHALEFVTSTTLSALSNEPVYSEMFRERGDFDHIELTRWADVLLVAPATANIIGKFAWGVADDLLSTLFVAMKRPVILAPAMNHDMWVQDSSQKNIRTLTERGVRFIQPDKGSLACGDEGDGRMAQVDEIVERTLQCFTERTALQGLPVLVTAGSTREPIDPVRFISNRSTGKMGFAVAEAFHRLGADVTLVTGPSELTPSIEIKCVRVTTAAEMFNAVDSLAADSRIIIKAAAVADYTPESVSPEKIKKSGDSKTLTLVRTKDILKHLGENKKPGQLLIGFSAESENHLDNAVSKLKNKNLDMIILNDIISRDCGFATDTNRVLIITPSNAAAETPAAPTEKDPESSSIHQKTSGGSTVTVESYPLMSKTRVANAIARHAIRLISADK